MRFPPGVNRWDEKAALRRDAVRSQGIDVLESTDQSKETGNEEGCNGQLFAHSANSFVRCKKNRKAYMLLFQKVKVSPVKNLKRA